MLVFSGQTSERKAQIRKAADGYSVFTWADYGGNIGIIQWRESHAISEWSDAYKLAADWLNGREVLEN